MRDRREGGDRESNWLWQKTASRGTALCSPSGLSVSLTTIPTSGGSAFGSSPGGGFSGSSVASTPASPLLQSEGNRPGTEGFVWILGRKDLKTRLII